MAMRRPSGGLGESLFLFLQKNRGKVGLGMSEDELRGGEAIHLLILKGGGMRKKRWIRPDGRRRREF